MWIIVICHARFGHVLFTVPKACYVFFFVLFVWPVGQLQVKVQVLDKYLRIEI